mmetsp:Transcript_7171/g.13607  ORF Transcript_7171/g.13607 Transcript_7171/m.13607 type:complete len:94 (+) Transcript_7171:214-495(+)
MHGPTLSSWAALLDHDERKQLCGPQQKNESACGNMTATAQENGKLFALSRGSCVKGRKCIKQQWLPMAALLSFGERRHLCLAICQRQFMKIGC